MSTDLYRDAARVIGICNSCRYCEGYCAVFPAIERRLSFERNDLDYLANLCHNCGACYSACQYAPPHEFAVNIPRALAQVRLVSYETHAWPRKFGALFRRQPAVIALLLAASLTLFFVLGIGWRGAGFIRASTATGSFYTIFPHNFLIAMFGLSFTFACVAITIGARRFWRAIAPRDSSALRGTTASALHDAAALTNLKGGGDGCSEMDHAPAHARRAFHHLTFYGFALCLASTLIASLFHYALDWPAPYPWLSAPVLLGTAGGIGLLIGPAGLLWLRTRRPAELHDASQTSLDTGFSWLLLITGATGLILLVCRDTIWMPTLLALHLGPVLALFLLLPYGKFVHGIYRTLALIKYRRQSARSSNGAE